MWSKAPALDQIQRRRVLVSFVEEGIYIIAEGLLLTHGIVSNTRVCGRIVDAVTTINPPPKKTPRRASNRRHKHWRRPRALGAPEHLRQRRPLPAPSPLQPALRALLVGDTNRRASTRRPRPDRLGRRWGNVGASSRSHRGGLLFAQAEAPTLRKPGEVTGGVPREDAAPHGGRTRRAAERAGRSARAQTSLTHTEVCTSCTRTAARARTRRPLKRNGRDGV